MIDVQSLYKSLKIKWLKGYLDGNKQGKWKFFVDIDNYLEKHGGTLVFFSKFKTARYPFSHYNISDPFVAKTVEYRSTFHFKNYSEDNIHFPSFQIWLNSPIRIHNGPFFYKL